MDLVVVWIVKCFFWLVIIAQWMKAIKSGKVTYHDVCWFDFFFLWLSASHWLLKLDRSSNFFVNTNIEENEAAVWKKLSKKGLKDKIVVHHIMLIGTQSCRFYRRSVIFHHVYLKKNGRFKIELTKNLLWTILASNQYKKYNQLPQIPEILECWKQRQTQPH